MDIPLTRICFGPEEEAAAARTLRSGWITQGPRVLEFERAVADYVGAQHGVAVTNATAGLHLSLITAGIGPGDEVILPSLTFIATANVVRYCGATPVFADVDLNTLNLNAEDVAARCTIRTKAIILVHQFGLPGDINRILEVARQANCELIEDAACALGATYRDTRIGSHSTRVCFSFHPRKIVSIGEGGMILTNNAQLADRLRRLRHHGRDATEWQRHESTQAGRERYVETGYNYRLTDIAAAIGLEQMKRLDQIVSDRRRVAKRYDQAFRQQERLSVAYNNYGAQTNAQTYMLRLIGATPQHRDTLVTQLREKGIGAKAGLACIHQEPCYADAYPGVLLPNSEQLSEQMLLLPLFPQLTEEQQDRVIESVCTIVDTMRVTPKPERRWSLV